jgi:hypothetical protein
MSISAMSVPMPVGRAEFRTHDGKCYLLKVKDDVTPLEAVNLSILLATGAVNTSQSWDWERFIIEKELERHFYFEDNG